MSSFLFTVLIANANCNLVQFISLCSSYHWPFNFNPSHNAWSLLFLVAILSLIFLIILSISTIVIFLLLFCFIFWPCWQAFCTWVLFEYHHSQVSNYYCTLALQSNFLIMTVIGLKFLKIELVSTKDDLEHFTLVNCKWFVLPSLANFKWRSHLCPEIKSLDCNCYGFMTL